MGQYAALFDALDDLKATFADVRRALLAEPGVVLALSRTRRTDRKHERWDLIRYREPGGPRHCSYVVMTWWKTGWNSHGFATRAEAMTYLDNWGAYPEWWRLPKLLEEAKE